MNPVFRQKLIELDEKIVRQYHDCQDEKLAQLLLEIKAFLEILLLYN